MSWHGDIRLADTIDIKFCTVTTTGAPTTLAGTPVVSAYPGNSTTQLTAGITLTVDFDGVTGLHNVRVAATGANGYATATNYALVITTGTVGGTSVVGYVVGAFSIENRSAVMPTTAARTLDVSAGGEAGVDWANVGSPTTTLGLSGTTVGTVTTLTGHTAQTGDAFARLGAPAGASVSADIAAIEGQTDDIGAAGAGLTAVPWNAAWDAEVQSECADALTAFGAATAAAVDTIDNFLDTEIAAILADTDDIQTRLPAALVGGRMDASVGAMATGVVTADAVAANAIGASELAADAVTEIVNGVWDEATAGHATAGTTGKALTDAGGAGTPLTAQEVANAVWDESSAAHVAANTTGQQLRHHKIQHNS